MIESMLNEVRGATPCVRAAIRASATTHLSSPPTRLSLPLPLAQSAYVTEADASNLALAVEALQAIDGKAAPTTERANGEAAATSRDEPIEEEPLAKEGTQVPEEKPLALKDALAQEEKPAAEEGGKHKKRRSDKHKKSDDSKKDKKDKKHRD